MPILQLFRYASNTLPVLAQTGLTREGRAMLAEMRRVQQRLPSRYKALPLPEFLAELTPKAQPQQTSSQTDAGVSQYILTPYSIE